jgi:DNA-binding NtrC family response regulator
VHRVGWRALAGRFARDHNRAWIDLATGRRVSLRVRSIREGDAERRWRDRLDALSMFWHPHVVAPVDYGRVGRSRHFEAWPYVEALRYPPDRCAAAAIRSAVACLAQLDLAPGRPGWDRARTCDGRVVLMPDELTGLPTHACAGSARCRRGGWRDLLGRWRDPSGLRIVGLRLLERSAVRWVVDVLDHAQPGDLRTVRLAASHGAGVSTFICRIAREARLRGYLPIDLGIALRWKPFDRLVDGRHLLLIDRLEAPRLLERVVLSPAVRAAHACAVVSLDRRRRQVIPAGERGETEVALDGLVPARLVEAVVTYPPGAFGASEVASAARQADGRPGRFVALLQGANPACTTSRFDVPMVHESTAAYGADGRQPGLASSPARPPAGSEGPSIARARGRAEQARAFAARGRHSAAERSWRAARAAFLRRGCVALAAETTVELAGLLAARGRSRDALAQLHGLDGALDEPLQVAMTLRLSSILVDEGRLTEGETAARAAEIGTRRMRNSHDGLASALALARCLMWQGRADEAVRTLPPAIEPRTPLVAAVFARRARLEVVRMNVAEAGRAASAAIEAAADAPDHRLRAAAAGAMATVLAEVGDEDGFRRQVRLGLAAARAARAPLIIARMHLMYAEGCARLGLTREYRVNARTLGRWALGRLPPLLRARAQHALGRMGDACAREACDAFVRATGARGIVIQTGEDRAMEGLQDLSDVLRICHESPDELVALGRVCAALRERTKAIAVSVVASTEGRRALAGTGAAWAEASDVSTRAVESGHVIAPLVTRAGLEAAVPLRYAGRTVGALLARWPIDGADAAHQGLPRLVAAAAATAPALRAALDRLATQAPLVASRAPALLGASPAIQVVRDATLRAARAPFSVLIEGESGSGKELVARAVHAQSDRRGRRLCALNCAAIGEDLLEAELFGHARGAFTGAIAERPGLFEEADGGTLLLDEVSELSPRAQAKLLRTIQEGEIRRVGESLPRRIDVRLIAASNRRLEDEVATGRFRADLRYRLEVVRIVVPPLRERPEDIPLLASHFWEQAVKRTGGRATLDPDTLGALARYDWPGNVRELQNVMTSLAVHAGARGRVGPKALPAHIAAASGAGSVTTLAVARATFERRFVRAVLAREGGHRARAAQALGVSRQGLSKLLRRLEIEEILAAVPEEDDRTA